MKLERKPENAEIPTSSMADIAFLLIIFFMVTAVFSATKGLEFKLPKDDDKSPPEEEEAVFVKVEADGSFTVDCKTMELTDHQTERAATQGVIALQLHAGPPMTVRFKNIKIRALK